MIAIDRKTIMVKSWSWIFLTDCRLFFFSKNEAMKIGKTKSLSIKLRPKNSKRENSPNTGKNIIMVRPCRGLRRLK